MPERPPYLLPSILNMKCPKCRKGVMFKNRSVFPLKHSLDMVSHCASCGQKTQVENNYGQGMNFVFIIIIFVLTLILYSLLIGISFKDNSVYYYLAVSVFLSLVLQPWLMRYSRVLFLYLVIPFGKREPIL